MDGGAFLRALRARGGVPAGTGDAGLTQPRALRLLFVQTKSNQKVAKTGGFGFLMCLICFAPEARSGLSKLVLAAYFDFCFYFRSVLRVVPIPGGTDCGTSLKCAAGRGTGSFLKIYANLSIVRPPCSLYPFERPAGGVIQVPVS